MKRISILGATGSIGASTLDIIAQHPEKFSLVALTANDNLEDFVSLCLRVKPQAAAIANVQKQPALRDALAGSGITCIDGADAMVKAASIPCDISVAAIVGAAGLEPILAALHAGAHVALANKEALVCAGPQVLHAAKTANRQILPLDSEHNAAFQCWNAHTMHSLQRLTLTASGGPFLQRPIETFSAITPQEAVAHPRWSMGAKISVDSATMMNKGLELIEAHYLFDLPPEKLHAIIHPQSIVHALLQHHDGAVLAQLSQPDMRIPISHALAWPERLALHTPPIDLAAVGALQFQEIEPARFPCFTLAEAALKSGQAAMIALNAANEIAVRAFLEGNNSFTSIAHAVSHTLDSLNTPEPDSIADVLALDASARHTTSSFIESTHYGMAG